MGHTNIETTLNVYGHLLTDENDVPERQTGMLSGMLGILVAIRWREAKFTLSANQAVCPAGVRRTSRQASRR